MLNFRWRRHQTKTRWMEECLHRCVESTRARTEHNRWVNIACHSRASVCRSLLVGDSTSRYLPGKIGGSFDVFGVRAPVGVSSALNKTGDMIAYLKSSDVLSLLYYVSGPVAATDCACPGDRLND